MVIAKANRIGNWRRRRINGKFVDDWVESNDIRGMNTVWPPWDPVRIWASIIRSAVLVMIRHEPLQRPEEGSRFRRRITGHPIFTVVLCRGNPGIEMVLRYSSGVVLSHTPTSWKAESELRYSFNSPGRRSNISWFTASTSKFLADKITRSLKYCLFLSLLYCGSSQRCG